MNKEELKEIARELNCFNFREENDVELCLIRKTPLIKLLNYVIFLQNEREKSDDILTELEEWLNYNMEYWKREVSHRSSYIKEVLEKTQIKLNDLKEKYKDENN